VVPPDHPAAVLMRDGSSIVTKVLYIEDNDDNVYMLKMRLELLGDFEVLAAEDGEKGCAMALSECPDIILMDLEMPVVDGWEATRTRSWLVHRERPGAACSWLSGSASNTIQLQSVETWPMQPCNSEAEVCLRAQSLYHCVCLQQ
jgi:CheY-like chemotaxis protein